MEMQLMIPSPAISPNATAPSTPIHAGFQNHDDHGDEFAFDFSRHLIEQKSPSISPADELFDCGKIKPLNPPADAYYQRESPTSRFTEADSNSNSISISISPRCNTDSFTETFHRTPGDQTKTTQNSRGRETKTKTKTTIGPRSRKVSRSSSPFRISDIFSGEDDNNQRNYASWYNKLNLKNLLLFRSASEGSARRRKDPINRYSRIRKDDDDDDDGKNSRFGRSGESCMSSEVVGRRRVTRKVSAHEIHYTTNRVVAEEMRRRTLLPYKSGLLGCLGFVNYTSGGGVHEISRGVTSVMKQQRA